MCLGGSADKGTIFHAQAVVVGRVVGEGLIVVVAVVVVVGST